MIRFFKNLVLLVVACAVTLADPGPRGWLLSGLAAVWALRLGTFLFLRLHRAGRGPGQSHAGQFARRVPLQEREPGRPALPALHRERFAPHVAQAKRAAIVPLDALPALAEEIGPLKEKIAEALRPQQPPPGTSGTRSTT